MAARWPTPTGRSGPPASAAPLTPFCAAAQHNADALRPLNGFAQRGSVPPDQLERTVDAVRNSGIELIASAPSDIRADVQIVVDALDAQLDALERANGRHRRRRAGPGRLGDGRRLAAPRPPHSA